MYIIRVYVPTYLCESHVQRYVANSRWPNVCFSATVVDVTPFFSKGWVEFKVFKFNPNLDLDFFPKRLNSIFNFLFSFIKTNFILK